MKQISQNLRTGKLNLDEVPFPSVKEGEILIRTAYSLISAGTERTKIETGRKSLLGKALARPDQVEQVLQSFRQLGLRATYEKVMIRLEARSPLGYSAAGSILQIGPGIDEFRPGDWVACGGATAAHAEVISVPKNLCVKVPEGVSLDVAAFTTVGAIAIQGIRQADVRLGEVQAVIGLGLLGQLSVQILKAAGCQVIGFDPDEARCRLAIEMGADAAFSIEEDFKSEILHISQSMGVDAVLITAGTESNRPIELSGEICRDKGRVVVVGAVGMSIPRENYYLKELELTVSRSYGPGRYDPIYEYKGIDYPYGFVRWTERRNMTAFLELAAQGKIKVSPLITHRYKLDKVYEAYSLISGERSEPYLGVLFEYGQITLKNASRVAFGDRPKSQGQLGVGLIGAGNFAQSMLIPHLQKNSNTKLIGVATRSPLESRDAGERFGFSFATTSPDEVLKDENIEAVVIATRHDSHADLAVQALNQSKAIHLEKPLSMNLEELEKVVTAYRSSSKKPPFLMVGFNRRFAPMIEAAKKFFSGRREPLVISYRINAGYLPLDHWTQDLDQGGGRIVGEVCHFIDLVQFFAGPRILSVYARALPNLGKYRDDNVVININLEDGSIATVLYLANGDKALPKEYLEIFGEGKVAIIDDFRTLTLIDRGQKRVSKKGARDKGHKNEIVAWLDAVCRGKPEPVPFDESISTTKATFAILESLRKNQVVCLE